MLRTLTLGLLILLPVAMLALGCAADRAGERDSRPIELGALLGEWRLESIQGYDRLPPGVRTPSLRFDESGRVTGFSGVNRLSASLDVVALERGGFAIGPAATTRMAGPPPAMQLEEDFLTLLQAASEGRVGTDRLVLGDRGDDLLVFRRTE